MAALCHVTGRRDDFLRYAEEGQKAIASGRFDDVPPELETILGGGYLYSLGPDRSVEWCRAVIARSARGQQLVGPILVFALALAGAHDEATSLSDDLFNAVDRAANPMSISGALLAYGHAHRAAAPVAAYEALRRGLAVAQDSGNRQMESVLALSLSSVAVTHAGPVEALTSSHWQSAPTTTPGPWYSSRVRSASSPRCWTDSNSMRLPPLSAHSLKSRSHVAHTPKSTPPSRICAKYSATTRYESIARAGMTMSNTAMAKFALEQIDEVRAHLMGAGESQ